MITLAALVLFASCRLSFPAKIAPAGEAEPSAEKPPETVIRSDAMEMQSPEGGDTVFRFTGNVQVESSNFRASAQALTAHLSGNPVEENPREGGAEASPHLTQLLAEGEVQIQVQQEEGERRGSADRVEIDPPNELFVLSGHAQIQQEGKGTVAGERIVLDRRKNSLSIGSDSPEGEASRTASPRPRLRLEPSAIPEAARDRVKAETAAGGAGEHIVLDHRNNSLGIGSDAPKGEASGAAAPSGEEESVEPETALPEENRPEGERKRKELSSSLSPSGERSGETSPSGETASQSRPLASEKSVGPGAALPGENRPEEEGNGERPFSFSPSGKVSPSGETASPVQFSAPEGRGLFAADAP
ncbi:MAG: hypothetical protein LBF21_02715 [Puniceicoccales bacterium]|jgi:lipopolysaccharide export system protein LptA|nr:hypothetical protein [Puniceicoccales bacterium]